MIWIPGYRFWSRFSIWNPRRFGQFGACFESQGTVSEVGFLFETLGDWSIWRCFESQGTVSEVGFLSETPKIYTYPHYNQRWRKVDGKTCHELHNEACDWRVVDAPEDVEAFVIMYTCTTFISAFWTLLREKPTKSLILYQFLRQGLWKDAKSDRNWCIWCQLLCDPTGMKHHNIHKTTKIHVFSQTIL